MQSSFSRASKPYSQVVNDIEFRVRQLWQQENIYATSDDTSQGKKYILGMFPYPSGNAHMGHALVYSITDTLARMERFKGNAVLHPLGWDAFGLPAENAAIQRNLNPADWTEHNIETMRKEQIGRMGFSFDPEKELNTASPEYYKWTQWLFLKLHESGLVYRSNEWVNWDPVDMTVLANEQVIDGKGWRSGADIERRQMSQWYIRITDYAEALWQGLDSLDGWSEAAKAAQRNWIGRQEGAEVKFSIQGTPNSITAFTTEPQALYDVNALLLPPESELIPDLCTTAEILEDTMAYKERTLRKSDVERQSSQPDGGVFTGSYVVHPLTGTQIPIYVTGHILIQPSSSAALSIPSSSERDALFSAAAQLPYAKATDTNNPATNDARKSMTALLEEKEVGKHAVHFRLRDWSLARQRFWGAPIPMLRDAQDQWHPVPEDQLPVKLPSNVDFSAAAGKSPLAVDTDFNQHVDESGNVFTREVDTMDTFMCSAWYIWRYLNPQNNEVAWTKEDAAKWMPVDKYVGGLEHANQHLIYLRFMSHFLYDQGLTPTQEPILSFLDNGMVQLEGKKMSKSRGNVVRPDTMIEKYGADALHMYILSNGPIDRHFEWDENGLKHKHAFIGRIYNLYHTVELPKGIIELNDNVKDPWSKELLTALQQSANDVENDVERSAFHVMISRTHSFANELISRRSEVTTEERKHVYGFALQSYLKILGLTAPHVADELWGTCFDLDCSLYTQHWINVPEALITQDNSLVRVPVMINGKKRAEFEADTNDSDDAIIQGIVDNQSKLKIADSFHNAVLNKGFVVRDKQSGLLKMVNLTVKPHPATS